MSDYASSNHGQLLLRARTDGDVSAVGTVLELYRSYLKVLARLQIGQKLQGKVDASDVVQEVFLNATRAFPQFQGTTEQEFLGWLRRILASVLAKVVRNFYGTQRRDPRMERELDQRLDHSSNVMRRALIDHGPSPSEQLARKEWAVILADAMEQLPDDYREVIMLRHIEQLTFPEIAHRMGRTVNSVKNVWPRALAHLRRQTKGVL